MSDSTGALTSGFINLKTSVYSDGIIYSDIYNAVSNHGVYKKLVMLVESWLEDKRSK